MPSASTEILYVFFVEVLLIDGKTIVNIVYSGGTLKIYGDAICPEVPYKTLLLSINDTACRIVRETLDKYGLNNENENDYCLIQV